MCFTVNITQNEQHFQIQPTGYLNLHLTIIILAIGVLFFNHYVVPSHYIQAKCIYWW